MIPISNRCKSIWARTADVEGSSLSGTDVTFGTPNIKLF
jgi:hypothetical protein